MVPVHLLLAAIVGVFFALSIILIQLVLPRRPRPRPPQEYFEDDQGRRSPATELAIGLREGRFAALSDPSLIGKTGRLHAAGQNWSIRITGIRTFLSPRQALFSFTFCPPPAPGPDSWPLLFPPSPWLRWHEKNAAASREEVTPDSLREMLGAGHDLCSAQFTSEGGFH